MAAPSPDWHFRCSSCGKCCNSPPLMSLPELFHHEHRFIGCLTVRRVTSESARLSTGIVQTVRSPLGGTVDVLLATQAFDAEDADRCPALAPDGSCGVHTDRKPVHCQAVPLDALVPERFSHELLASRAREAAYLGADCLSDGPRPGSSPVVRRLRLVDDGFRGALSRRREDLVNERRVWGDAVFRLLRPELFDDPDGVTKLPNEGFFALSIAPVLMVLAEVSPRLRARCTQYLDAQQPLVTEALRTCEARRDQRETERQLRTFRTTITALRRALATPFRQLVVVADSAAVEAWAGVAPVLPLAAESARLR